MVDSDDLQKRLRGQRDHLQRVTTILEWTLSRLPTTGAAIIAAGDDPSRCPRVMASRGSLSTTAPLLAVELARVGMPRMQTVLSMASGSGATDTFLCIPLGEQEGAAGSVLVLDGPDVGAMARAHEADLHAAVSHLREAMAAERSGRTGGAASTRAAGAADSTPITRLLPSVSLLTDGLRLPLYVCDPQGRFTYASPACLELTGHRTVEELAARGDFFRDPRSRADEIETARSLGKVVAFPLSVTTGSGAKLDIRDSVVSTGNSVLGVFFDVTALMAANAELKDALQVQELLNDNILSGAKALQRTQGAAIRSLARLAEYRDPETGFHLQRICEYARLLAMEVHLRAPYTFRITGEYANDISLSSMLHDIGKVSIPDSVLLKPGKLDPGEWEIMKKHTVFGWEVLHKADRELGEQSFLTLAATIALSHHERYDGKGYPHGSAGEKIPLSARIIAVVDVYDALTTARPYKEAWSHERAAEEIVGQEGLQFDPVLVSIFSDLGEQFAEVRRRFPG